MTNKFLGYSTLSREIEKNVYSYPENTLIWNKTESLMLDSVPCILEHRASIASLTETVSLTGPMAAAVFHVLSSEMLLDNASLVPLPLSSFRWKQGTSGISR